MSGIPQIIFAEQESSNKRVIIDANGEKINFPVRKTKNKLLQKTLLQLSLSITSEQSFFNNNIRFKTGSKVPELSLKYKGFKCGKFFGHFLDNMKNFSEWMYVDDQYSVSIVTGFGDDNECLVITVELIDNGEVGVMLDFQRYIPHQINIIWGEKFMISNGYTFDDKLINSFLPVPEPVPEPPKQTFNCCICFDDFDKGGYKCRICKEGNICKGCCKKMRGVKKCPICRS